MLSAIINGLSALHGAVKGAVGKNGNSGTKLSVGFINDKLDSGRKSSIAKRAEKSVAFYPIVLSDKISIQSASLIARSVERNVSDMIKLIIINQTGFINLDSAEARQAFLENFRGRDIFGNGLAETRDNVRKSIGLESFDIIARRNGTSVQSVVREYNTSLKANANVYVQRGITSYENDFNMANLNECSIANEAKGDIAKPVEVRFNRKDEDTLNRMTPTIMTAEVQYRTGDNLTKTEVALAIKAVSHIVSGSELVEQIAKYFTNDTFLLRLIRWQTGEIGFFKDLVLNVKDVKETASGMASRSSKASAVVATLRHKADNSAIKNAVSGTKFLPTTTLVITKDENDELHGKCGVNLYKDVTATRELCEGLGLIGVIIVDEVSGIIHYYNDGDSNGWDSMTMKEIKSDNSANDTIKAIFGSLRK